MGEAIADAWKTAPKGTLIYHVDGAFHSDYGLGTVERAKRRAPSASSIILTAIPVPDLAKIDPPRIARKQTTCSSRGHLNSGGSSRGRTTAVPVSTFDEKRPHFSGSAPLRASQDAAPPE